MFIANPTIKQGNKIRENLRASKTTSSKIGERLVRLGVPLPTSIKAFFVRAAEHSVVSAGAETQLRAKLPTSDPFRLFNLRVEFAALPVAISPSNTNSLPDMHSARRLACRMHLP